MIQTVDSEKLARRLDQLDKPLEVMIEVKLSEEESKAGAAPEELPALIAAIRACANLRPYGIDDHAAMERRSGSDAALFPEAGGAGDAGMGLTKLSMGMSHDLEAAIEEGSTHIRVGTALFGPRIKV